MFVCVFVCAVFLSQSWMDQYFTRMQDMAVNKDLPSRIRFMLMDAIELRKSNVRNMCPSL